MKWHSDGHWIGFRSLSDARRSRKQIDRRAPQFYDLMPVVIYSDLPRHRVLAGREGSSFNGYVVGRAESHLFQSDPRVYQGR